MDTLILVAIAMCWAPAMGVILLHDRALDRQSRAWRAGDPDTFVL